MLALARVQYYLAIAVILLMITCSITCDAAKSSVARSLLVMEKS